MHRRLTFATAALLLALTSCDNGTPVTPNPQPTSNWTRVAGGVATGPLYAVWVSPGGRIYTGDRTSMIMFDGTEWSRQGGGGDFRDMWGTNDRDVFAVRGGVMHYDGTAWKQEGGSFSATAIWGTDRDVFTVGSAGGIYHRSDGSWSRMQSPTSYGLLDIWGASAADVFAVGTGGRIIHFDGREWSVMLSGAERTLAAVGGRSATDVVAAGDNVITHFDGTAWKTHEIGLSTAWRCIWREGDLLYVSGYSGRLVSFDGRTWNEETGFPQQVTGVSSNGRTVTAVTYDGKIFRKTDGQWRPVPDETRGNNLSVISFDDGTVAVAGAGASGGRVDTYDGLAVRDTAEFPAAISGMCASGPDNIYAISYEGTYRYDGIQWTNLGDAGVGYLRCIWGLGEDSVVVAGSGPTLALYDGISWGSIPFPYGQDDEVRDMWGTGPTFLLATTSAHGVVRYDGATWSDWHAADAQLIALSGTAPDDVWGVSGRWVVHDDGTGWTREITEVWGEDIVAIASNDVYVAGEAAIGHFDGNRWTVERTPALPRLVTIAASPSGDLIWAAGGAGAVLRLDRR